MTRAVVARAYGGPEVLTLVDLEPGDPGPGQVLVRVVAAGVNPADWKTYTGAFGTDPSRLPLRLGSEAAGVVVDVGSGDHGVQVGDAVVTPAHGAYAEAVLVAASDVVPKPPALAWAQAGGLLLTGTTAAHTLAATDVGAGDTVLVHGASGGVGAMVVQLAVERGATVIGTARRTRLDLVAELGGTPVEYGPGLADRVRALAPDGVSAAVDTAGTPEALDVSVELVADRGRIATIAASGRGAELGVRVLGHGAGADPGTQVRAAARPALVRLAAAGRLRVRVGATYPLEDVAAAHRAAMAGEVAGKTVLLP